MKNKLEKRTIFRSGLAIFPNNDGKLDQMVAETMRDIFWESVNSLVRPTILNVSEDLGVNKARLSRIIDVLGIRDRYRLVKAEKLAIHRARIRVEGQIAAKGDSKRIKLA